MKRAGRPRKALAAITAALLAGLSSLACGWRAGLSAADLGPQPDSIGVEVFDVAKSVLERNLEPRLHRELTRSLSDLVPTPLESPARADWVLEGRINQYQRRSGIRSSDHLLLESGVRIYVTAELRDRRTGELVGTSSRTSVWSGYATGDPESERAAADRALRYVAETLVLDLFGRPRPPGPAPE